MNKWIVLLQLLGLLVGVVAVIGAVFWWLSRRYERTHELYDDGGTISSPGEFGPTHAPGEHHL